MRLGATHLTVTDLDRSIAFYQDAIGLRGHRDVVGFDVMTEMPTAVNVWRGRGVPPAPAEEGLLRDPSGNAVVLTRGDES